MKSIYAIGDIHGCYEKLRALMEKIDICPQRDTLIFLGDYIDRGPQSYEVVDYLITLKHQFKNLVFLKGNHEIMLLDYLNGVGRMVFLLNGGKETLDSYYKYLPDRNRFVFPKEHLDFMNSLVLCHQTEDYIFVHAGLRPGIAVDDQVAADVLWIRDTFIRTDEDFGKRVIFGHTRFQQPLISPNKIGIDTGAVYGNCLTCIRLPDIMFFSAP
ncbi:MAG: serine/threonine protein phosphatase [Deltaproteobacteria bacterium]|nr:serine/threonine protein phosphatase [Deltaproteobacteria bacterium]